MIIYDGSMDKKAYKNVFAETIDELLAADSDMVYLDADLMSSFGTLSLVKKYPGRVVDVGIAEANMMGIAAGLSAGGKKPYVHSFGPFATRRSFDQSFLSIAYAGQSVRIIGSDPGVTAAFNGGTHMPFEDMALMRAVPTATVIEISDGAMLRAILTLTKDRLGLIYIRTSRKTYPALYSADHHFEIGKGQVLREGRDLSIIACGLMVGEALKAAQALHEKGIEARVVDCFTVKPLDEALVLACARETGAVLTAENHNVIGGLGDAVASVLLENGACVPFTKCGVMDRFGQVGPQDYLQRQYGLTTENLAVQAEELAKRISVCRNPHTNT
ncbi:MAG: transketolase C-terminal domain-containing protein [Oscillospiraceae bacterium]|nr:transketolase C-terminal domain-containing protein [Oscillospiraceae bacterium]